MPRRRHAISYDSFPPQALGTALRAAGTPVEVRDVGGTGLSGYLAINRDLGKADYAATLLVDAFLTSAFAR